MDKSSRSFLILVALFTSLAHSLHSLCPFLVHVLPIAFTEYRQLYTVLEWLLRGSEGGSPCLLLGAGSSSRSLLAAGSSRAYTIHCTHNRVYEQTVDRRKSSGLRRLANVTAQTVIKNGVGATKYQIY